MSNLITIANKYIGQSEDGTKGNNNDFRDEHFEQLLRNVGWSEGLSWCAFFVRMVVHEAYPNRWNVYNKLLSGSVLKTLNNLTKQHGLELVKKVPSAGYLAFWQNGNTAFGHIAFVRGGATIRNFTTIEGNTDSAGSRDGGIVAEKVRNYRYEKQSGLWLRGFIDIEKDLLS